jgi:NADPH:quinone reductase-like Zn-dependent oxidoreductase
VDKTAKKEIKMKVIEVRGQSIESLALAERAVPKIKPHQVLVKMKAASLNYRDLLVARGQYGSDLPLPLIPVSDGAGEVVELGSEVQSLKKGDRVAATFFPFWNSGARTLETDMRALGGDMDGVLAEYVAFAETSLVKIPASLTYEEAASLPCAGVTAWNALYGTASLQPGETVLVLGTGGVSTLAAQFAKSGGARVIATTGSAKKIEKLRSIGVTEVINYRDNSDWENQVLKLTDGLGVDHVIEVGGAGTLAKSLHAVRPGGRISLIGVLTGFSGEIPAALINRKSVQIQGIYVGNRTQFIEMNRAIEVNRIKPVIDSVFALNESVEAYKKLESGSHFGKIVIAI